MQIRPLVDDESKTLRTEISKLETLLGQMAKDAPGRKRVEDAAKRVAARIGPLLETKDDDKWMLGEERKSWCALAHQPLPNPTKLADYLGRNLACEDDTDKAYVAQRLIRRFLDPRGIGEPNAFLEAFKGCPAAARIPADLKLRLERAAQQDRDNAAKGKESPEKTKQPPPPKVRDVCTEIDAKPPAPAPTNRSP
jgi:hypothetical protein